MEREREHKKDIGEEGAIRHKKDIGEERAIRLNKYIAACGRASRRQADLLIEEGRVVVNGQPAKKGATVFSGDVVELDGEPISPKGRKLVLAYYKPRGTTCTERDPHARRTIYEDVPRSLLGSRLTYAGRLDKESEGLLLLTNDGSLIDAMMRGSRGHEKVYEVTADKPLTKDMQSMIEKGMYLEALKRRTRPCKLERLEGTRVRLYLREGLNRQIRRMYEALSLKVLELKRIRVVTVELGNLRAGEFRELSKEEIDTLYKACGL